MQFASFEIMQPIVNVQTLCPTETHYHTANSLVLLLDQNVNMMMIVQVNWHVYEKNALNHAKNYHRVHHQLDAVFWTAHRYEHWFVIAQNYLFPMKMVNVVVL